MRASGLPIYKRLSSSTQSLEMEQPSKASVQNRKWSPQRMRDVGVTVLGDLVAAFSRVWDWPTSYFYNNAPFYQFGCFVDDADLPAGTVMDGVKLLVQPDTGTVKIAVHFWRRLLTSTSLNSGPGVAGDELLASVEISGAFVADALIPLDFLLDLSPAIGSDVIAALTLYNHSDGGGTIHTQFGFMWKLKDALAEGYGSTVSYLNFGIGGTNSSATANNGRDATRLAALTGSAADLVFLMFGQNELGSSTTEANTVAMIQALQAVGKEAVVVGVPRRSDISPDSTYAQWLLTNRALRRAAEYTGAGYLDLVALYADENAGALGIHPKDFCQANLYNHPGIRENLLIGQAAARDLLDE
jgi:hypothetical protein